MEILGERFFSSPAFFFAFCPFKIAPNNKISTHLQSQKKGLQLLYCGKNDQKKEHAGSLTLTDCKRLVIEYKSQIQTVEFANELQKTTKVDKLQSLLIDYKSQT